MSKSPSADGNRDRSPNALAGQARPRRRLRWRPLRNRVMAFCRRHYIPLHALAVILTVLILRESREWVLAHVPNPWT
jgi:hypothetical protein